MNSTAVLLLAAGRSQRLGSPKQLLKFRGKSLLLHTISELEQLPDSDIYVVLGSAIDQILPKLGKYRIIKNNHWEEGMGSSIAAGIMSIQEHNYSQVLITLCDLPLITTAHYAKLLDTAGENKNIIASQYHQLTGVPVIFNQIYFKALAQLTGDEGARKIILNNENDLGRVKSEFPYLDVDTLEDYERLLTFE